MPHTFTSLRYTVERLQEAEHFLARLAHSNGQEFQFELNAFLSACRSVTFVMQKSFAHVEGFDEWYAAQVEVMKTDDAMRFFLELRNISQKQGPVSYVGGSLLDGGWTYRFVSDQMAVPLELIGRDIAACCGDQLQKLARVVAECARTFPFDSCPVAAFTAEGMKALGYSFSDVEVALGLPMGYTNVGGDKFSVAEKLSVLCREIEPLDTAELERLAAGEFQSNGKIVTFQTGTGLDLVDYLAAQVSDRIAQRENPRGSFLQAVMKRINDIESQND